MTTSKRAATETPSGAEDKSSKNLDFDYARRESNLGEETDYDNFKSEVAHHQGKAGAAYEHSLHDVWSVMNRLQK